MKRLLHDPTKSYVAKLIHLALEGMGAPLEEKEIYNLLSAPPQFKMGHWAFPCFPLARTLKKAPPMIAGELAAQLSGDKGQAIQLDAHKRYGVPSRGVAAKGMGPYVNFELDMSWYGEQEILPMVEGSYFKRELMDECPKTMIEFSQPNTHKVQHVGHMVNLALGDALARLHRATGHELIKATYPGDSGTHVAKCLWYLKDVFEGEIPAVEKGKFLGEIYTAASKRFDEVEKSETEGPALKARLAEIMRQIGEESGEFYELWSETRGWSLDLMHEYYQWAGVNFDVWFYESEVDKDSVALVREYLEKGVFVRDQGAVGCDLKADKLGFCLLLKQDGHGLYATKDLELARIKFEDYQIEKSLYVVDSRQSYHFSQVFKTLEKMGFPHAKDCEHLKYEFLELPEGPMSSRAGNIVPIMDLIHKMEAYVTEKHLKKYEKDASVSAEERAHIAHLVAQGAIKYGMLKTDTQKKIVFEMQEWLNLEGNSGPYLQYICARIKSLLKNVPAEKTPEKLKWSLLTKPIEGELAFKLTQLNAVVAEACAQYKPSLLTTYLFELGKLFNSFYVQCPIGKLEDAGEQGELKRCRRTLTEATLKVMTYGLDLLGIQAPERM